jgi:uncharacterized protein YndB with AHSA1/START domain
MDTFDRIQKTIILRAPISRVWQAIANEGGWTGQAQNIRNYVEKE